MSTMKILVIHPEDPTTNFLCATYVNSFTIIRTDVSDTILKKLIRSHDIIIMMGHGDQGGLFGFGKYVIDSSFVDDLRKKVCIGIWCYASTFIEKYNLKTPFSTGMFISEVEEAYYLGINFEGDNISDSNYWFVDGLEFLYLNLKDKSYSLQDLKEHYQIGTKDSGNSIIEYNVEQFYSNITYGNTNNNEL